MIHLVYQFNKEVLGINERPVDLLDRDEFKLSMAQLKEEIEEIEEAYEFGDLAGVIDGLIDLDYYHKGIVYKHGIKFPLYEALFGIVHEANCTKKSGENPKRTGFNQATDAIKPSNFKDPKLVIEAVINNIRGPRDETTE